MKRAFLCAVGMLLLAAAGNTAPSPETARTFLAAVFAVTSDDFARVDAGQVVARTISGHDSREVATLGLMRLRVTPEFYVDRLTDIVTFKRDESVLQIGLFGEPPAANDIAALTLDESDIARLRECRVDDCGVQLSAEAIDRLRKDVNWAGGNAESQANYVMRQILVEYVTRYRAGGMASSMRYADQHEAVDLAKEFSSLLDADVATWRHFAGLRQHLLEYPAAHTPGTTDIVYWSKERTSRRVAVSVTHLAISRLTGAPAAYAIASKQIYGTHYFDASLGLTVLLRDPSTSSPAMYVVYVNRSRLDVFKGIFGGIARRIVTARARTLVSEQLGRVQRSVEHQFAAQARRAGL